MRNTNDKNKELQEEIEKLQEETAENLAAHKRIFEESEKNGVCS